MGLLAQPAAHHPRTDRAMQQYLQGPATCKAGKPSAFLLVHAEGVTQVYVTHTCDSSMRLQLGPPTVLMIGIVHERNADKAAGMSLGCSTPCTSTV